jgi:hypothetical protein
MPILGSLNWTTTTVPLWQVDCENFRKTGQRFELRDVNSDEHRRFIEAFAARYDLKFEMADDTAVFQNTRKKTQQVSQSRSLSN